MMTTLEEFAMPVHDWRKVGAGVYHSHHLVWAVELARAMNSGLLTSRYYAMVEPTTGTSPLDESSPDEMSWYVQKRRVIAIRQNRDDRLVSHLAMVTPGLKSMSTAFDTFVRWAVDTLLHGVHLLVVDLFPPGKRDPHGIHGAIWARFSDKTFRLPADKPLTLASYTASEVNSAYIEPFAVGDALPDMPLFLEPDAYVNVPLEATYAAAWHGMPARWKRVLEGREE